MPSMDKIAAAGRADHIHHFSDFTLDDMVFGNTRYSGLDRTHDPRETGSLGMEIAEEVADQVPKQAGNSALAGAGVEAPSQSE